jgi:hypothetical protein
MAMSGRMIWVQGQAQQMGAGAVRTWHLEGSPGETLCGRPTLPMKATPGASWNQVLNPCSECQAKEKVAEAQATAESQHNIAS